MLEKIENFKNFAEKNNKALVAAHLISGLLGIVVMLGWSYNLGALIFAVSGFCGAGPRLLSHGLYSATGLVVLYWSMLVGVVFGVLLQVFALVLGYYLMFGSSKR